MGEGRGQEAKAGEGLASAESGGIHILEGDS